MYSTGRMPADPHHSQGQPFCSRYLDCPTMPLYPFGHGLTYTTFQLDNPRLSANTLIPGGSLTASVTLQNTGNREAAAVVQLYIHDLIGSVVRPIRQLKDFRKLTVKPGEAADVSFVIDEEMLKFQTLNNGFAAEPGAFEVILSLDAWSGEPMKFTLLAE